MWLSAKEKAPAHRTEAIAELIGLLVLIHSPEEPTLPSPHVWGKSTYSAANEPKGISLYHAQLLIRQKTSFVQS